MYILLSIITICIIYVASFKSDFDADKIKKVGPALVLIFIVIIALCVISAVITNKTHM